LSLAEEMSGGIVGAARILVVSGFGEFLLEDFFGVGLRQALENLECISEGRGVGVVAKTAFAVGLVAAIPPAFPEEDDGDKGSEEPETEGGKSVDQEVTSIAPRGAVCAKTRGPDREQAQGGWICF
jgi:hypothetical protein